MKASIALLTAMILAPSAALAMSASDPVTGMATVIYVVDGDTYDLKLDSRNKLNAIYQSAPRGDRHYIDRNQGTIRVRLGSIDTSESVHPDASKNTEKGHRTSVIVKRKLEQVRVSYKCYDLGYYKRVICHIGQNGHDLGAWLISHNLSEYIDQYGSDPYRDEQYRQLDREY